MRTLLPAMLTLLVPLQGCHRPPGAEAEEVFAPTTFLRTKWSPTHAYKIEYLDTNALNLALKKDGKIEVLEKLRREFLAAWPYLEHTRFTPEYLQELAQGMEGIETGSAQRLILDLTSTNRYEMQNDFRDEWLRAHNPQGGATKKQPFISGSRTPEAAAFRCSP